MLNLINPIKILLKSVHQLVSLSLQLPEITDFMLTEIDLFNLSKIDGPLLQEILCNGKKIYQQQDHLLGVLWVRLMDWCTDLMPAWENILDQLRFLT